MIGAELGHGFRLLELGAVTSTNDVARELADAGEPSGLFVRAERQTRGRGRLGRSWQSPAGNLYTTLLLRPRRPLAEIATLSLVTALALAEAVGTLSDGRARPRLKWPNDLLLDGAKVAGILLEATADGRGGCLWLLIGIGVNIAASPGAAVPYPTTHLQRAGLPELTPRQLLPALAAQLGQRLDDWERAGFAALRQGWLDRAAGLGSAAEVKLGDRVVRGRLRDVDAGGALHLELPDGSVERFAAGEIVLG